MYYEQYYIHETVVGLASKGKYKKRMNKKMFVLFLIKLNVSNIARSYQRTTIRMTSQLMQHSKEPLQIYATKDLQ